MTAVLPAPVADVKQRYDALSEADKSLFAEVLSTEREDIPWPMDELRRRAQLAKDGLDSALPIDEAFANIRTELARRREARMK